MSTSCTCNIHSTQPAYNRYIEYYDITNNDWVISTAYHDFKQESCAVFLFSFSFYSAVSFWLHLNNSKSQISQHLIRINQREIEKNVQNLPALFLSAFVRKHLKCLISKWSFWNNPCYCISPDPLVTVSPKVGKIAAENKHKWAFTLSTSVWENSNKNVFAFWRKEWKSSWSNSILQTLLGISCLLSTVYQSLYLHLGPGLTGREHRSAKWNG